MAGLGIEPEIPVIIVRSFTTELSRPISMVQLVE